MFTAHELMGALYLMSTVRKEASWIVRAGVGMIDAHVLAPFDGAVWILASMILAIAVCTHICVSAKSLSLDVSAPRSSIAIVRAIAITPTFVVIAALLF